MFGQVGRNGHLWVEERLSDYIDNRLPPVERARIERHLQSCEHCRASLDSMRWTVSLLKRAPAPALPRSFVLPVPARPSRVSSLGLSALRFATALATLLLVSLVGIDLIFQFGGGGPAPMAASRAIQSVPPTNVAQVPPTSASSKANEVAPMAAPATPVPPTAAPAATAAPTSAPAAASAAVPPPPPTTAPQPWVGAAAATVAPSPTPMATRHASLYSKSASPTPSPTPTLVHGGAITDGSGERSSGTPPTPTPPLLPAAPAATTAPKFDTVEPTLEPPTATAIPPTATPILPTAMALPPASTPVAPGSGLTALTGTPNVQAYARATQVPGRQPVSVAGQELPAIRAAELGLLVIAGFLGLLTILAARKR